MRHYHISSTDLGEKFEFSPRLPESAGPKECPHTPRVCFAPTVWQCMIGVCGTGGVACLIREIFYVAKKNRTLPVVYETRRKLTSPPELVSDYSATGEMWSLVPIECRRRGYIDLDYLLRHEKVRLIQNPALNVSAEFYAGWEAGQYLNNRDWKENPPK